MNATGRIFWYLVEYNSDLASMREEDSPILNSQQEDYAGPGVQTN